MAGAFANGHQQPMEALSANPVECLNYVVPTLVRLERAKEREDVRREIFAISAESVLKISGSVEDGKMDAVKLGRTARDSHRVGGLVECRSKAFDDVIGEVCEPFGQGLGQLDLVELVSALRVRLNDTGVWLFLEEIPYTPVEFGQVFLCACDSTVGAIEWGRHGQVSEE